MRSIIFKVTIVCHKQQIGGQTVRWGGGNQYWEESMWHRHEIGGLSVCGGSVLGKTYVPHAKNTLSSSVQGSVLGRKYVPQT